MTDEEKLSALMHSKTNQFKRNLDDAQRILEMARCQDTVWFTSWSGGKDSSVVFDLCHETDGIFSDDEFWLPETEELFNTLTHVRKIHWIRTNATHTEWFSTDGDFDGIQNYATEQGFTGVFLGLRRQENKYRRVYLDSRDNVHQVQKDGFWHCNPIANWSTWDVWGYLISKNINYNRAYDKLAQLGVPFEHRRIGPFANARALTYGQIAILKQGWPEQYNRFVKDHHEASRYV